MLHTQSLPSPPPLLTDVNYSDWRELDSRVSDGLTIAMMWKPGRDDRVSIVVEDARRHRGFVFSVDGADARDAFEHAMSHAPEGGW